MCYLAASDATKVDALVVEATQAGEPFTGWEVARKEGAPQYPPWAISARVREMFNNSHPCFNGWACTKVGGDGGPLLFFKISRGMAVSAKIAEIKEALGAPP